MKNTLSPEQLAGILEIADNAIVCTDEAQRIVFFNQGAERIFGWRAAEVIGQELAVLIPPRFRAGHGRHMAGFRSGEQQARNMGERGAIYAVRKDGSEFPAEASISRSHTARGWLMTAILQDISERQAYERALEAAKEKAEAAMQAKSMFLANMSHEIRTPLNAVIGMTSLLLNTGLDEEQRDYTETIRHSGEALLAIINDLLDYSKMEAGRLDIERHPVDLRRCVEDALDLLAPAVGGKDIELACVIEPEAPATILADAARLRQVLVNLLSNAVKFTRQGEVVVEVAAAPLEGQRHALRITVRDSGIGIPAHRLDDIFESFTQVDPSTTREYGGTGLGLAISRRLAAIMGGALSVESRLGAGSRFTLAFEAEAVGAGLARDLLQDRSGQLAGRRLLIVDDNATNRRILVRQALLWGMEAVAAASAAEALDLVRHGQAFDAAILDMHMPEMNGEQLAAEIRRAEGQGAGLPPLPLLLLTSLGQRARAGAVEGLFAAALNKPVKPAALFEALLHAMGGARPAPVPELPAPAAGIDILVAEDNTVNQKVVKQLLRHLGHRADIVANGVEALEAMERQDYGVILMDMQMPEMDGIEATRRLRRRFRGASAPWIIAMTANALPGDRERCLEAGMDAYLPKPVVLEELRRALAAGIGAVAVRRRAPEAVDPARLRELRGAAGGNDGVLEEVIAAFLDGVPPLLARAGQAIDAADGPLLAATAHYLLSSIDCVGAGRMRVPCLNLELLGKADNVEGARAELAALAREFEGAREALRAYLS
ncbi:response regulator [Massilia sp. ZL223]|uniref:response regulator n=1 Tax=Massilia sp. ZL223 TaxID=2824904 RepID=UPI001B832395|nr:response regulator [Massilia sp. ZL223]MBQ5961990.1 response regulator [Massilia sp. ZL223]